MGRALAFAVVALAACWAVNASARFDDAAVTLGSSFNLPKLLGHVFDRPATVTSSDERKAVVLIEYAVLPPVQEKFVEIFKAFLEKTKGEEGVKVFGLSRTVDENLTFYLYSEWDDMKAYGSHYAADYTKEYLEAIAKIGVVYKLHILDQIAFIA